MCIKLWTYQVEYYYRRLFRGFLALCSMVYNTIVYAGELLVAKSMVYSWIPPLRMENVISPREMMIKMIKDIDYISAWKNKLKIRPFLSIYQNSTKYSEALEKAMREKGLFEHITKAEEKFSKSMSRAILNKGLFTRISNVDEKISGSVDKAIGDKGVFDKVASADTIFDGMVDKVIFSKIFWGMVARADGSILTSDFLKKFINLEKSYDSLMEKILFGMIGSEDLSKIKLERTDFTRSWFLNLCKKVARIHTGDISNYISWIAIALTVIIVVLVGIPYLKTLFAIILAITLTIFSTFVLALFFL